MPSSSLVTLCQQWPKNSMECALEFASGLDGKPLLKRETKLNVHFPTSQLSIESDVLFYFQYSIRLTKNNYCTLYMQYSVLFLTCSFVLLLRIGISR